MKKDSTPIKTIKKKEKELSPKDSTIAFLMNFARVYSCENKAINFTGGYLLN
ncbi:MAG: hypothetical protein IJ341_07330 [Bacteroidales bacterium]|nr:hypothetical protein [Bacteroidales bacterium]